MSRFDWCARGDKHSGCIRSYVAHNGRYKGETVYCQCDKSSCKCSKNPRTESGE